MPMGGHPEHARLLRFRRALANRRFQLVLLLLAGVPVAAAYLWRTVVAPIGYAGSDPVDFFEDYVPTGRMLANGLDPYSLCMSRACWIGLTDAWSVYPPVVSWLSQPLYHVEHNGLGIGALLAAQACVAVFLWAMAKGLAIRNWKALVLMGLVVMAFPPLIDQVVQRNIEVLLLAVSGIWFAGWVGGDRWWAGAALGTGIALKLVQAPLLLLVAWRQRFRMGITAVVTFFAFWAVGAPQLLPEYLTKVLPSINAGTGYAMDIAPVGAVARLFHPGSLFGQGSGIDPTVRAIGFAISLGVLMLSAYSLRTPMSDPTGLGLQASAVVAATPLMVAVVRPGHLLLLLLPMLVVGTLAVRTHQLGIGVAVGISWLLTGPLYLWYTNLVALSVRGAFVRPGEEIALLGVVILWITSLVAVRRHIARSLYRARLVPEQGQILQY